MYVFISHKSQDLSKAQEVQRVLKIEGHQTYLDAMDDEINKNGVDLADLLRKRLGDCDSLIAVISSATKGSWWVPWEIGVATEKDYPLSTYQSDVTPPPDYLKKWPILKTVADLQLFARKVKEYQPNIERMVRLSQAKSVTDAREKSAENFHKEMKTALGQ